jgi:acetyl esterase/lipase
MKNFLIALSLLGFAVHAQPPVFQLPDTVERKSDIIYAHYGDKRVRLDLYRPKANPTAVLPGIVVIRGGGWRAGDKNLFAHIAAGLAARGFAAACIEYRVMPEVTIREEVNDAKAAVRWMRGEAKTFGINPNAIGAIGGSAAGQLVALLATSYKVKELEGDGGHPGVSSRIQAVVPLAGVFDFETMPRMAPEILKFAKLVAPITYLDKDAAPFLLIHSNADKSVPLAQSEQMLARLKKLGVPAELVVIDKAPHGFWNMPQWSAETIDRAAKFFHSVLM